MAVLETYELEYKKRVEHRHLPLHRYTQIHRSHEVRHPSYVHSASRTGVDGTAMERGTSSTVLDTGTLACDRQACLPTTLPQRTWRNRQLVTEEPAELEK